MVINFVESLARPVAAFWQKHQSSSQDDTFNVASPLSSTPLPIYQWVLENSGDFTNWDKTNFILMDEQVDGDQPPYHYIPQEDPASYEGFARRSLLDSLFEKTSVDIKVIKPELQTIASFNPRIDLLILALGTDGNYANVMPGTLGSVGWHVAHLTQAFRQTHTKTGSKSYENAKFRKFGMSLGPQQVIAAKKVIVIISGPQKHDLAMQLLTYKEFDPIFPLSIIYHPQVVNRVQIFITNDVGIKASEA